MFAFLTEIYEWIFGGVAVLVLVALGRLVMWAIGLWRLDDRGRPEPSNARSDSVSDDRIANLLADVHRAERTAASLDDPPEQTAVGSHRNGQIDGGTLERVAEAIRRLSDHERRVTALHYFEGMSLPDIAEVLDAAPEEIELVHVGALLSLRTTLGDLS